MIDPKSASVGVLELIGQMKRGPWRTAPDPARRASEKFAQQPRRFALVKTRIASLDNLIAEERAQTQRREQLGRRDADRVRTPDARPRARGKRRFASAFTSLEAARLEAQRQQLYLETIAQPNLADYPLYPKRMISFGMVLASCLLAYGIAWLLVVSARASIAGGLAAVAPGRRAMFWRGFQVQRRVRRGLS